MTRTNKTVRLGGSLRDAALRPAMPVVAAMLVATLSTRVAQAQCGADLYGSNTQVGGGAGYGAMISRASATFFVDTRAELVSALASAQAGDIVWIENYAQIDLIPPGLPTTQWMLAIPADVTLASDRGQAGSEGGLLYFDKADTATVGLSGVFQVHAPGVRITGLRLSGSDTVIGTEPYDPPTTDGIVVEGLGTLEVDNCELRGFSHGAIYAVGTEDDLRTVVDVHHNHIHHNRRTGLGYGVVLKLNAYAIIESNVFDHNRHDIAGTGDPRQGYEARYNLVVGEGTSHAFDMHGEGESAGALSGFAGADIRIEYNTFVDDGMNAVRIRGAPYDFGYIDHNVFTDATLVGSSGAIRQIMFGSAPRDPSLIVGVAYDEANPGPMPAATTNGLQRMRQSGNCFDHSGWFRFEPRYSGFFPLAKSDIGISSLAFGRFDADLKEDVFRATGSKWQVSYGGTSSWVQVSSSNDALASLRFGNFVGDSRTDVFRVNSGVWQASDHASGTWTNLSGPGVALSEVTFGNFVGDSRTDVFRTTGSAWQVSNAGGGAWQHLAFSSFTLSQVAFGNFVGDSRTDVLRISGTTWYVSDGAATNWQQLATHAQTYALTDLAFGDFTGDGRTDVLRSSGNTWYVSDGGVGAWSTFASFGHGSYALAALRFADVTGDGKTDVFFAGKP